MDEAIRILITDIVKNPSVSYELRSRVLYALDPNAYCIYWSVEDFECQAENREEYEKVKVGSLYDRSLFLSALETMIEDHDCNNGITWDHIDLYLDDYCKIEK